ncbi:MAG: amino acid adenylation domain-containing protein [Actinomycetota bacterium]|nr:amino acid adenylation domain-containing protein [Actinomycetota bacterium]
MDATRPFDLSRGPLMRAWLARLGDRDHVLGITMHHIVSDGWSVRVLLDELSALYGEAALPPLTVQYADYAAWHRRWLEEGTLQTQLAHWKARLAGAPAVLELPADRPRPPVPSYRGASFDFEVGSQVGRALQALARAEGASPFMVLLGAFGVVLARHAGVDDVVVGTPVAGRVRPELERLIGFFVNTLVLRTDLAGDPTFTEALARVRDTTLDAFDHQDLPFERLVLELDPVRDLSRNPLVQVLFQMVPLPAGDLRLGDDVRMDDLGGLSGGEFGETGGAGAIAPFDIDLFMAEAPGGALRGTFVYATDLFDAATVARLAEHFVTVLEAVAADPTRRLSELPLMSREEEHLLGEWGGGAEEGADDRCLQHLVEEQVARTPEAVAVVGEDASLTYAELDHQAAALASQLVALGVGPEVVVGMCLPRSRDLPVAVLGILKAGGAVLPLDPNYPRERLEFMLADSNAAVVINPGLVLGTVSGPIGAGSLPGTPGVRPDNLAYVIYTSGSTGQPRGVMLTHRSLVSEIRATAGLYGIGPDDRVLQFCSISFDVSVEELFTTWAGGATVVLKPDDRAILGRVWLEWLQTRGITVLNLPTAYWHEWVHDLQALGETVPAAVRLTIAGGEKALGAIYRSWREVGGDRVRWINAYGPTETSVMATAYEPPAGQSFDGHDRADPPIGRPIANTTVRLLDGLSRLTPIGVPGELHIGGWGLARGYLGRPELTANQFVPDSLGQRPGGRLYRSGDMARFRADGQLEFVGRADQQVKVRGFRIETGEVENALLAHRAVSEAVVVAREDGPGTKRLVAYVVPVGEPGAGDATELRRFLSDRLPAFMVPTAFVFLDTLPLTPNGKVDREALPAPTGGRPELSSTWVAPLTPVEQALTAIWESVLGVEGLGAHDDFFELGGHSLLATQVIAQLREQFGVDIPLRELFEGPTVAALAAAVEARGVGSGAAPLRPQPRPPGTRIPLGLAQEQMWRLEVKAVPQGLYNITALHRFSEPVDRSALRRAVALVTERHETLRTGFLTDSGQPSQEVAETVTVELPVVDLTDVPDGEQERELQRLVAAQDAEPFELSTPPLLRSRLYDLGPAAVLALTLDHLICDGTSAYILLGEVTAAYDAVVAGRTPDLPPLEIQFADFALWQRATVTQERLQTQLDYWMQKLDGMPLGPAVPFDHRPEKPTRRIRQRTVVVPPAVYEALERVARTTQSTMFVVCVAAVDALLSRAGGVTDVVLSTTLSGRQRREVEGLIGMFAGISRLRTDLSSDPTFSEIVLRARETVWGMFEHQDIPFMEVRRALVPGFPTADVEVAAVLPNELGYFRVAHQEGARGAGIVERPADELFFRGQLHPLSVTFLDDGRTLWIELSHKLDWYDDATVERLAGGLERLLAAVSRDPGLRLSALPLDPDRS